MSEVATAGAEADQNTAVNMTASEFEFRRGKQLEEAQAPEAEPESQEEVQEEEEQPPISEDVETETQEQEPEDSSGSEDVLSQIDLDKIQNLSEEDRQKLAKALGSRAVDRFGELTARAKTAEERVKELETDLQKTMQTEEDVADNPYADLNSVQEIQKKAKETSDIIDWAEDILFDSSDYGPDDNVTEIDGKAMTKSEVREALKQAKKSRDKFLPQQFKKIKSVEEAGKLRQEYGKKAIEELEWLQDKDSDQAKQFVQIASNPEFVKVYKESPSLSWQLPYLLAHAVNSITGSGEKPQAPDVKKAFKPSPPKSPGDSSSKSKNESSTSKVLKDLEGRFKSSGSKDDFLKMREMQIAKALGT